MSGNLEQLEITIVLLSTIMYQYNFKNNPSCVYYFYHSFFVFCFKNLQFLKRQYETKCKELFPRTAINIFIHARITPWVKLECYQTQHICVEKGLSFAEV